MSSFIVRDGRFDVVIAAGPRVDPWPSAGVRSISTLCAEMGLSVGYLGGETLSARGVIPLPGTGGLVIAEDAQKRIHRIHARAVVRLRAPSELPDPFPGSRSPGLIPLTTALKLQEQNIIRWAPTAVILGSGNRALRFGSSLLDSGVPEVICVETTPNWGAKRFAGWEVERRRFEIAGGKLIEARPVRLSSKAAMLWELRVEDAQGIRVIEASRIVSAGPFSSSVGIREYPPGSFLFELEQTAGAVREEDIEGWIVEEERGRGLAVKIVKALAHELGPRREELDRAHRRARIRLKRYQRHFEEPFTPAYQGKWLAHSDAQRIRSFSGIPKSEHRARPIASIECIEEVGCNVCEKACPASAIDLVRKKDQVLNEAACTGCGVCVNLCPSGSIHLIHEKDSAPMSQLTLAWRGARPWKAGELATLLNRRGESLGSGRIVEVPDAPDPRVQLVRVEVPSHLASDARGIRRGRRGPDDIESYASPLEQDRAQANRVEILLDGEKRLVRDRISISMALFETGQSRPEDILLCPDGSCGLCQVTVDGIRKLGCQTPIHRGMAIRLEGAPPAAEGAANQPPASPPICPCLGVMREDVLERTHQGRLQSADAVAAITHVGEGKCHGQLCRDPLRRLLLQEGLDAESWIDWQFPWSEWALVPQSRD
jgi:Fe-S-cluster-containing hydrogenase component 2